MGNMNHPEKAKAVPRLVEDLHSIQQLLQGSVPLEVCVRYKRTVQVIFGFYDASKDGFGNSFLTKDGLIYQVGVWSYAIAEESSNFREFRNPLDALEREGEAGNLKDAFVLLVTNNS